MANSLPAVQGQEQSHLGGLGGRRWVRRRRGGAGGGEGSSTVKTSAFLRDNSVGCGL